jgi:sugar/nucleoside kinase (ribokinase family)
VTTCTIVGNVNVDLIVHGAAEVPAPGTERTVDAIETRVGGGGANAALAAAALGGHPRLVGRVGDDHPGRSLASDLEAGGVSTDELVRAEGEATGVSIAFESPDRDRSFLISLGSLATFEAADVPKDALAARFLLVCGYFLHPRLRGEPTRRILDAARAGGAVTVLDTGWDPQDWPDRTRDEVRDLIGMVDVFVPNESEARALTGESDPRNAIGSLQRSSGGTVLVKLGPDGCLALAPGGEAVRLPAPPARVTDTTGAGDAFNAGLLLAMASGQDAIRAARFAVQVASTVVSRPSADRFPSMDELPRG